MAKVYSVRGFDVSLYQGPVLLNADPGNNNRFDIGRMAINLTTNTFWGCAGYTAGNPVWVQMDNSGGGVFATVTTTGAITAGTTMTVGTTLTVSGLGLGVVQSSAAGVFSSSDGAADGQILIADANAANPPVWANILSGDASILITNSAGGIDIRNAAVGAASFVTDVAGPVAPLAGVTTFTSAAGGNIQTDGTIANTVEFNIIAAPSFSGGLTVQAGTTTITSDTNALDAIFLHANSGVAESIRLRSQLGNTADSVNILSDAGGITLQAVGLASNDAINFESDSGGIDADAAMQISFNSSQAAGTAISLDASNVAGGMEFLAGTGGFLMVAVNGQIDIESGTSAINVGADAVAHTTTLGSITGVAATVLQSGTGNLNLTSTDQINLDATGTLEINSSGGIISIGNDAIGQNMNFGTGAAARAIVIGNATGATSLALNIGTGAFNLGSNATDHATTLGSTTVASLTTVQWGTDGGVFAGNVAGPVVIGAAAQTAAMTFGRSTAANTLNIGTGINAGAQVINVATGASAADSTLNILSGIATVGTQTANLFTGASTSTGQAVNIMNGAGAGTRVFTLAGTGALATTIGIGDGLLGNIITMGNGINSVAQTVSIANGAAAADSTVSILSGLATAGTQTLNLANGDFIKAINIGNGIKGNTILMANGDNDTAQIVSIANGASAANSTVNVLSGAGTAGAGTLNLANNVRVTTVDIGDVAPDVARSFNIAGGDQAVNDTVNILTGNPSLNTQAFNVCTGTPTGGTQTVAIGNATAGFETDVTVASPNFKVTPGTATDATGPAGTAAVTINQHVGVATLQNFTTAGGGATLVLTVTNSVCTVGSAVLCSASIVGAEAAELVVAKIRPRAGTFVVTLKNTSAATAVSSDIIVTFWIVAA